MMLSAPTRHSKVRAIKRATSLVMTKHKIQADRQLRQTDLFLKNYKLRDIATQIKTNAYFVAFRFVATPAMDISALKKALSISSATLTFIEDIHTAHFLHADQTTNFEWVSKFIFDGPVYLFVTNIESEYLTFIRAAIRLEDSQHSSAILFTLLCAREASSAVNLRSYTPSGVVARTIYNKWDSKESVLIELLSLLSMSSNALSLITNAELVATSKLLPLNDEISRKH